MKKITNAVRSTMFDLKEDARAVLSNDKVRKIYCLIFALMLIFCSIAVVFATSGGPTETIEGAVKTGAQKLFDILKAVSIPVGIVAVGYCFFQLILGSERDYDKLKKRLLAIIIAYIGIFFAPAIVIQIRDWFSGVGDGAWDKI